MCRPPPQCSSPQRSPLTKPTRHDQTPRTSLNHTLWLIQPGGRTAPCTKLSLSLAPSSLPTYTILTSAVPLHYTQSYHVQRCVPCSDQTREHGYRSRSTSCDNKTLEFNTTNKSRHRPSQKTSVYPTEKISCSHIHSFPSLTYSLHRTASDQSTWNAANRACQFSPAKSRARPCECPSTAESCHRPRWLQTPSEHVKSTCKTSSLHTESALPQPNRNMSRK
jgi:hypothetical protein